MSAHINTVHLVVKQKCLCMIFWEFTFVFESHIFRDLISTIIMPCYSTRTMSAANLFHFFYFKKRVNVQFLKLPLHKRIERLNKGFTLQMFSSIIKDESSKKTSKTHGQT